MITPRDIEAFMDLKQGGRKEVFSSIVGSKSRPTRNAAMASATMFCEKILEAHPGIASISGSAVLDVASQFQLNELMTLAEAEDLKLRKTVQGRVLTQVAPLRNLALRLLAFLYDLDYRRIKFLRESDQDLYYHIGDAILLSGLYLEIEKSKTEVNR